MSAIEWIVMVIMYVFGVMLSIAAFGKLFASDDEYHDDDSRYAAIALSIFFWPICLLFIAFTFVYRKTYGRY
jgi:hypothetical protein